MTLNILGLSLFWVGEDIRCECSGAKIGLLPLRPKRSFFILPSSLPRIGTALRWLGLRRSQKQTARKVMSGGSSVLRYAFERPYQLVQPEDISQLRHFVRTCSGFLLRASPGGCLFRPHPAKDCRCRLQCPVKRQANRIPRPRSTPSAEPSETSIEQNLKSPP